MHELGVLCQIVKKTNDIAIKNGITMIKHITLEVGETSSYVPLFFQKLFPAAISQFPVLTHAKLKIQTVPGNHLVIKDIGY